MSGAIHWNPDPEIINLFHTVPLRYYGLLFATGLVLGYLIVRSMFRKENVPVEKLDQLAIYIFVGTLVGARLGHCLFYDFDYYSHHILEIFLPFKINGSDFQYIGYRGLASHGGAIGILIAILVYCKRAKINLLWILDKVAIATPLSGMFIRLGNFMNSEIIGKPTNSNYGFIFESEDLLPRHPAQLYEAFAYALIFVVLFYLYSYKRQAFAKGFLFGLFLVLLFAARFILEFYKENQEAFEDDLVINMGQILSIPFIIAGIILMYLKRNPESQHADTASEIVGE